MKIFPHIFPGTIPYQNPIPTNEILPPHFSWTYFLETSQTHKSNIFSDFTWAYSLLKYETHKSNIFGDYLGWVHSQHKYQTHKWNFGFSKTTKIRLLRQLIQKWIIWKNRVFSLKKHFFYENYVFFPPWDNHFFKSEPNRECEFPKILEEKTDATDSTWFEKYANYNMISTTSKRCSICGNFPQTDFRICAFSWTQISKFVGNSKFCN